MRNNGVVFLAAVRFLTILPLGRGQPSPRELGASQGFFPLVGLLLGLALAGLDAVLGRVWPPALSSALLVAILLMLTGALHLEGFLDTCDGLLGGDTRERRLQIMRDGHVGAFAVAGGVSLLLLKWAALLSLPAAARFPALVLFPTLSRWSMVLAVRAFPYARAEGLGAAFREGAAWPTVVMAASIALAASFILAGTGGIVLLVMVSLLAWLLGRLMCGLLGGLTGDTYGALNEISEVVALVAAVALGAAGLLTPLSELLGG